MYVEIDTDMHIYLDKDEFLPFLMLTKHTSSSELRSYHM
jgi:hypothetical protein